MKKPQHILLTAVFALSSLLLFYSAANAINTSRPFASLTDNTIIFESQTTGIENVLLDTNRVKKKKVTAITPSAAFSSDYLPKIHIRMSPIVKKARKRTIKFSFIVQSTTKKRFSGTVKVKMRVSKGKLHISVPNDTGTKESLIYHYTSPTGFVRGLQGTVSNDAEGPLIKNETDGLTFDMQVFKDKVFEDLSKYVTEKNFSGTYSYSITLEGTNLGIEVNEDSFKPAKTFKGKITFN